MITRTFRQKGTAFGSAPGNITAKVDNVVVYQGPVVTLDQPFPTLPNLEYQTSTVLFSWTANVNFEGTQVIEISTDSNLLLCEIEQNYAGTINGNTVVSSGPDEFRSLRWTQFGNTYINEVLQSSNAINHESLDGQWWWRLPANSVFVENINILPGLPENYPNHNSSV